MQIRHNQISDKEAFQIAFAICKLNKLTDLKINLMYI